ncbi:HTH-type transcriptional regulator GltR [Defluviimonas aquaemixtae]|uniref:HTH-type transcriptional regulator GltR n=1 Tax=Albidovulum aquaemixtae TaxID=1542388 RepID=A0A2R8B7F6_9RHOB|nr:LysR family transcriptional regulator [Defluviimonas aquaemixtae]SPH18557.1 HTH-type transcriptional regulator GltR [Defluviimonas aquaemixtae]
MPRNLDLTALRALVAVTDAGGVTRAAGLLNLTQSAVSMQIKRLEESLDKELFARAQKRLTPTVEGELLLHYARRMLQLNDEALTRLTDSGCGGDIRLGVPHDIVYPAIPQVLQRIAAVYPCMRVNLVACFTPLLKEEFAKGEYDLILTTEEAPSDGGEILAERPLVWVGANGGTAWRKQPLRLGFEDSCRFRPVAIAALDRAEIPWEMGFSGRSLDSIQSMILADLAISARMRGLLPEGMDEIGSNGVLPDLGTMRICLYDAGIEKGEAIDRLKEEIVSAYSVPSAKTTTLPVDFRARRSSSASPARASG